MWPWTADPSSVKLSASFESRNPEQICFYEQRISHPKDRCQSLGDHYGALTNHLDGVTIWSSFIRTLSVSIARRHIDNSVDKNGLAANTIHSNSDLISCVTSERSEANFASDFLYVSDSPCGTRSSVSQTARSVRFLEISWSCSFAHRNILSSVLVVG